jgi:hypothetical protein
MHLVRDIQFLMICLLCVQILHVYEVDICPVMLSAVNETGNKIVIGVNVIINRRPTRVGYITAVIDTS